ncbi:unnamed protein product [Adineta ricciae]|uniref:Uncharacterized protein n=1 Tax=Adineta ricciae TaxID=249248 RepID=A0A813UDV3_ADIRI|nr:unnamed protein product [Adineta ricciae]CAF1401611.1 unnamed protein product [Adineta ricciae]
MYENADIPISTPSRTIYQYETIASPFRTFYQNTSQQPAYVSFESIPPSIDKDNSLTPPFQKKLPIIPVIILGFCEILGGLIVLTLEVLVFDLAVGLWCGFIYALAGIAALVLAIGTDRERHQATAVLIFQLVALMFSITEIILHADFYRKRCLTKPHEPSREAFYQCQILLIQIGVAAFVLIHTIVFAVIYFRTTIVVLKQPHGTFNLSNAINFTC